MARVRTLSPSGDYTFGENAASFLVNSPEMVAQNILTRLNLWLEEWFVDTREGTPWEQQVLGKNILAVYDLAIRTRVLQTQGVSAISKYQSQYNGDDRSLSVSMTVGTIYGETTVETVL